MGIVTSGLFGTIPIYNKVYEVSSLASTTGWVNINVWNNFLSHEELANVRSQAKYLTINSVYEVGYIVDTLKPTLRHLTTRKYVFKATNHTDYLTACKFVYMNEITGAETSLNPVTITLPITDSVWYAQTYIIALEVTDGTHTGYSLIKFDSPSDESVVNIQYTYVAVSDILESKGEQAFLVSDFNYDDFDEPSEPDGYGQGANKPTFDKTSDTIGIPDAPSIGISSAGFVNVYHVTQGQLQNLGSKIFPDITLPTSAPADIQEALEALYDVSQFIINSFQNSKLIDYVIDCHIIPVAPSDGASASIHVGYKDTEISAPRVSSDYVDFDCGSISIGEYYANYIDYLTRARLFLPFVGFIDLKPEFWQSGTINVRYRFNVIDGSFMAYVKSTSSKSQLSDTVIGQYGGNSCVHIPLTGLNYSSFISGLVTGSMSLAASAQSGNVAGAVDSALSMLNNKPSVAQSNNYNSSTSFLGVRRPYLMIERPVASFSQEYTRDHGLPLNVTMALSSITGFTVIDNIDLIGFDEATSEECEEIKSMLQSGVIF